jgi:hypothetical protein
MCSHGTSGNILPLILTLLIMVSRAKATLVMRAAKLMGQRPSLRRRPSDSEAELCNERSEGRKPCKNQGISRVIARLSYAMSGAKGVSQVELRRRPSDSEAELCMSGARGVGK